MSHIPYEAFVVVHTIEHTDPYNPYGTDTTTTNITFFKYVSNAYEYIGSLVEHTDLTRNRNRYVVHANDNNNNSGFGRTTIIELHPTDESVDLNLNR